MNFHGRALSLKQNPEVIFKADNGLPCLFHVITYKNDLNTQIYVVNALSRREHKDRGGRGWEKGGRGGPDDRGLIFPRFPPLLHYFTLEMFLFLQNLCLRRKTILI